MARDSASSSATPRFARAPFPHWSVSHDEIELRFLGRSAPSVPIEALAALGPDPPEVAWLRQIHSARVQPARAGACGEGDALWTTSTDLALCVVTADCVPVVCAAPEGLCVIHAGWRGLEAGVIRRAIEALPASAPRVAWIGPAIGPCCYEVGVDVAERVAAASDPAVVGRAESGRPHLDLARAAEIQLRSFDLAQIHRIDECTKCRPDLLWSHRGAAAGRGRNLTVAWRQPKPAGAT